MATLTDEQWIELNDGIIAEFRTNGGACGGRFEGNPMLLLTTTGARTGETRVAPLTYTTDGDHLIVIASKAGAPGNPAWYFNIVANTEVNIELGDDSFTARAWVAAEPERTRLFADRVAQMPRFGEYQELTERKIPVVVIEPSH